MSDKNRESIADNTHTVSVRKALHSNFSQSAGRAEYVDLITHHNERCGKHQSQKNPEPDYDEEGMAPHN